MNGLLGKAAAILLIGIVALGATGWAFACFGWSTPLQTYGTNDVFTWVVSNDSGGEENGGAYRPIDLGDNGLDPSEPQGPGVLCPRYDKNVARTVAVLNDCHNIAINLQNGYPCYYPTIFFGMKNNGNAPAKITGIVIDENAATSSTEDIPELWVSVAGLSVGQVIDPCAEVVGSLRIHIEQCAAQNTVYSIRVTITNGFLTREGTIGFWRNWCSHKTYSRQQIQTWLRAIDGRSCWLGPTTTNDLVALIDRATSKQGTMRDRFLAQYLCACLNTAAGRQSLEAPRDVTSYDPGNYLGLAHPSSATLSEIAYAIERKFGTSPTSKQFNTMMSLCNALNNNSI